MELAKKIYNDAVASAKKVLGKDGELPKPRVDLPKVCDEANKTGMRSRRAGTDWRSWWSRRTPAWPRSRRLPSNTPA